jgi:hypothetical protein
VKKFNNHEEAKADLYIALAGRGISTPTEIAAEVAKIVAAIPASSRDTYNADPEWAAAEFAPVYYQTQQSSAGGVQTSNTATAAREKVQYVQPVLAAGMADALTDALSATKQERLATTASVSIERLIIKTPLQKDFLTGKKAVPKISADAMAKYEANLVDDPDNRKAFEEVKAAHANNTPLDVNVSETAHTLCGVRLKGKAAKGAGKAAGGSSQIMTMAELTGFIVTETMGVLATDISEISVGAKLRQLTPATSTGGRAVGESKLGKPGITIVGRLPAIKENNFDVVYKQSATEPVVKKAVSLSITFKVRTGKTNTKGEALVKTVRPKGELVDYPNWEVGADYTGKFEIANKNVINSNMTADSVQQSEQLLKSYYAAQLGDSLLTKGVTFGDSFMAMVRDVENKAAEKAKKDTAGIN